MKSLFVIPARSGSKGIPGKNTRVIGGKPLFLHTLHLARRFTDDGNICITTNDAAVIALAGEDGYKVPFVRPDELSSDTAAMNDVLKHALHFYEAEGKQYDTLILLQPTSPFRLVRHVKEAIGRYTPDCDMVVSVRETEANPYYVLFEENQNGLLQKSKSGTFTRRQDCPKVWQLNGAVYVINTVSLKSKGMQGFNKLVKSEMEPLYSLDLDKELDWELAMIVNNRFSILPDESH